MRLPPFLKDLNAPQREAVTATEGRVRVIAGAGTGKTKALTYRYAYLVNVLGIDPANILCLTFTNKAAAEMRTRISGMVQSGDYNDFVCTLHGFCVKFLRKEIHRLGYPKSFGILDEDDSKSLAKECLDEMGIKREERTVKEFLKEVAKDKALDGYIDAYMLPASRVSPEMRASSYIACYTARQQKLYALDFDDLMNFTIYILDRFQDAREHWQNELNYVMVDEAQDCNTDDWNLVEKLSALHGNLFVVGDPDQCIYEWRGARPGKFVDFASDTDVVLDENYRSTPHILDLANSVISNNINRIPKNLFTRRGAGDRVIHYHGSSEADEMEWVVRQVRSLMKGGACPSDFAVLYRSSYLSRSIEQALLREQIPYAVWGGIRFFERREIKDTLSYMRLVANADDDISFLRVVNVPSRKLGKVFLDRLKAQADVDGTSLFRTLEAHLEQIRKPSAEAFVKLIRDAQRKVSEEMLTVSDTADYLLVNSGLKSDLRLDQDEDRLENVDELIRSITHYEQSRAGTEPTLVDYLQDIALYTNADYRRNTDVVKLMTIHQAKGLEFPFVFVIGLNEGIFPNLRSIRERKKEGEEEERRLMYVAVTRAQNALFLTESEGFNASIKSSKYPSRFLAEIRREMMVHEGSMSEDLWKGTARLTHVLDEETFAPASITAAIGEQTGIAMAGGAPGPAFEIGQQVEHDFLGLGVVRSYNDDFTTFVVEFGDGRKRNIRLPFLHLPAPQ